MHSRASSVARLISARVMSRSRLSRFSLATSSPFAPAMFNHMCASTESLRNTFAVVVPDPEIELRSGVTLVGGQPVPAHSFGLVLENALAVGVHETEVVLGSGVTLLGGQPVPAHSFGLVLENAPPVVVHEAEVELGTGGYPARQPAGTSDRLLHRP